MHKYVVCPSFSISRHTHINLYTRLGAVDPPAEVKLFAGYEGNPKG